MVPILSSPCLQGFRKDITAMLSLLPAKASRQTLLFSATMPEDVMTIAHLALKESFQHVDCVGEETNTHQHVDQSFVLHTPKAQFAELARSLREGMAASENYKIM